jgi:cytochrome b
MEKISKSLPMRSADLDNNKADSGDPIRVWDVPTRCFHWTMVCLVCLSWITADSGLIRWHLWSGSLLLTLPIFRIVWGVVGSTTARFRHFVRRPRYAFGYLKSLTSGVEALPYPGHNPAGGWMVIALIAVLGLQVLTGLCANDDVHFNGPLALLISNAWSDQLTQLHSMLFDVILLLVWLHVVAVGFYFFVKGENLIRPMFTGRKDASHMPTGLTLRFTHPLIALLLWGLSAAVVLWIVWR